MVQLEESDAAYCNSLWKYHSTNSEFFLKSLIAVHGGYGLRDKETKELLSFAIINDHLAIGMLTTVEKAQKKGYGRLVVKYLAKKIAEKGYFPLAFMDQKNEVSYKTFSKLGFKKIGDSNWISMG